MRELRRRLLLLGPARIAAAAGVVIAVVVVIVLVIPGGGHRSSTHRGSHLTSPVARAPGSVRRCAYTNESIAGLAQFARLTGTAVDCAEVFNTPASTWTSWAKPWFISTDDPDEAWARWARGGAGRQLTIAESLIPLSAKQGDWLRLGSEGAFTSYARELAQNLVTAGLGHVIVRLGPEANGTWEPDTLPATAAGQAQWREFWRRTAETMRAVPGAHFQFDWTVNALERPIDLKSFYPGDDVVDIIGIDAYEFQASPVAWTHLRGGVDGLDDVAAFARAHGKPLSLPEWGIVQGSPAATKQFFDGFARFASENKVAYESYFFAHQWRSALSTGSAGLQAFRDDFAPS